MFDIAVEPDEGPRPARAPGLAAAARRAELDGPAARRPRAAPRARPGEHPVARARVLRAPGRHRRPAARAAARALRAAARRCVRARGRRRRAADRAAATMARTIVTAHRADDDAAREPGLRARLRRGHLHARWRSSRTSPGVANRSEPEVVRRLVAEIRGIVDARERYFRANGIDSIETYRSRRAAGRVDDGYGDVFLVVDGWPTVRAEFDELEPQIHELAGRGLTFGVHVIVTSSRWMDFRNQIRDVLGTRIEMRLGDPSDSEVDRRRRGQRAQGPPRPGPDDDQAPLPRRRARGSTTAAPSTTSARASRTSSTRVNAAWTGPRGPKLRLLPAQVTLERVRELAGPDDRRLLLGLDESDLAPIGLDLAEEPHVYLFGDSDSGKSAFLRSYAHEVARLYTPDEAKLFVVDYRRALLGELPESHLGEYLTTEDQTAGGRRGHHRVPAHPAARARRHARAAAGALVVAGGRGLLPRRRLRPRRHLGRQPAAPARAAARAGRRRRPAPRPDPPQRRRLAGDVRAGAPVGARPGLTRHPAVGQPRRGRAHRAHQAARRSPRGAGASCRASWASRCCSWRGSRRAWAERRAAADAGRPSAGLG